MTQKNAPRKRPFTMRRPEEFNAAAEATLGAKLGQWREKEAREAYLQSLQPGVVVEGKGIYFGTWAPKAHYGRCLGEHDGPSLGKVFNLFAAPVDLSNTVSSPPLDFPSFTERLRDIMRTGDLWCGHGIKDYIGVNSVTNALRFDLYDGEWFMPPETLLIDRVYPAQDTLFKHCNAGAFSPDTPDPRAGVLKCAPYISSDFYDEVMPGMAGVDIATGERISVNERKTYYCRLVRLEPR